MIEDEERGAVRLYAHRVMLAASSRVWHQALSQSTSSPQASVLRLDPEMCRSAAVALCALRFLYTGKAECSFERDGAMLMQLFRLCVGCGLPSPLRLWALDALLRSLEV